MPAILYQPSQVMSKSWAGQGLKGGQGSGPFLGKVIPNPKLRLLDQVREVMRIKHYSIRTERCYCDWIRRYIHFHKMLSKEELTHDARAKIELFLSDLAVNGKVAAATQNQAFNALLFLYHEVLDHRVEGISQQGVCRWAVSSRVTLSIHDTLQPVIWQALGPRPPPQAWQFNRPLVAKLVSLTTLSPNVQTAHS